MLWVQNLYRLRAHLDLPCIVCCSLWDSWSPPATFASRRSVWLPAGGSVGNWFAEKAAFEPVKVWGDRPGQASWDRTGGGVSQHSVHDRVVVQPSGG